MSKIFDLFFRALICLFLLCAFFPDCLWSQDQSAGNYALSGSTIFSLLSSSGRVIPDVEANSFMVVDHPSNLTMIEEYMKMIDVPQDQVLIEARIVEVKLEGQHSLGVNWALNKWRLGHDLQTYGAYTTGGSTVYPTGIFQGLEYKPVTYPPITGTETDPFTFGIFNQNIDIVVKALTSELDTDIISAPKITTTNNRRAKIDVLKTIPYLEQVEKEEQDNGVGGTDVTFTYNYTFADEGVSLEVTPLINPDGSITMTLVPQVKEIVQFRELVKPEGAESAPALPETDVRIANTKVTVQDGQTLVIGGLIREKLTGGVLKVPLLGDIPLLGNFFRSKTDTKEKTELLIFVSPTVITPQVVSRMGRQQREMSSRAPENYYAADKEEYGSAEYPGPADVNSQVELLDKALESLIGKRNNLRKDINQE